MTCNCSYNYRLRYPITAWGEQLSIMVQLELLILLKLHFEDGGLLWRLPPNPNPNPKPNSNPNPNPNPNPSPNPDPDPDPNPNPDPHPNPHPQP
jgi:hypothetical protein